VIVWLWLCGCVFGLFGRGLKGGVMCMDSDRMGWKTVCGCRVCGKSIRMCEKMQMLADLVVFRRRIGKGEQPLDLGVD
jgi:hypothetical protein